MYNFYLEELKGFESRVCIRFVCLFGCLVGFFKQIFIITVLFEETVTNTAKPQVLETSSDWGNDTGGD